MKRLSKPSGQQVLLASGDILVLALITLVGFASHGTLDSAGTRMLTSFFPLVVAWFLMAPLLGAYHPQHATRLVQAWRPFWAMVLAGPWMAFLRAALLNVPVAPLFVIILGGFAALGILGWRLLYILLIARWLKHG
jgi:K+ transporter